MVGQERGEFAFGGRGSAEGRQTALSAMIIGSTLGDRLDCHLPQTPMARHSVSRCRRDYTEPTGTRRIIFCSAPLLLSPMNCVQSASKYLDYCKITIAQSGDYSSRPSQSESSVCCAIVPVAPGTEA